MIQVFKVDENGFFKRKSYFVETPNKFEITIPVNTNADNNFYQPKWDWSSEKWIEGWTQEQIEEWERGQQIDICALKENKVQESKEQLAKWLSENPMLSEIHNPEGEYYTVTQEKQTQLTQLLMLYSISQANGTEMQLTWNSTGGICEEWTYEQLSTLSFQIAGYVLPRVKKQQLYEVEINNCDTKERIEQIEIEYDTI